MRALVNVLEECSSAVNHLAKHLLPLPVEEVAETASGDMQDTTSGKTAGGAKNVVVEAINSREVAFKQLLEIAQFFKKTEPHSPVSHALEKAVKWGNMALEELIVEWIPDEAARKHFTMLTGVKHIED